MLISARTLAFYVPRCLGTLLTSSHPALVSMGLRFAAFLGFIEREDPMLCRPTTTVTDGRSPASCDPESLRKFPILVDYLGQDTWEDGSVRETSTVLCVMEDGVFKACLIDKDADRTLWVSCGALQGLLPALEARLGNPGADWRKRKEWKGKPRSR